MPDNDNDKGLHMPQLVPPTEFNLSDPENNREWLDHFSALNYQQRADHILLPVERGECVVHSLGDNEGYLFRVTSNGWINYLVRYYNRNMNIQGQQYRVAKQVMLWIDRINYGYDYTLGRNAFYQIMLEKSGIVITDIQQTDKGRNFWLHRVYEVLDQHPVAGLYAYLWDRRTHIPVLTRITIDNRHLLLDAWSWKQSGQMSRLIISKQPLPATYTPG